MEQKLYRKNFIITGASKGLGEVIATEYSKYNMRLVLLGREEEKLQRVVEVCKHNGSQATYYVVDLISLSSIKNIITNAIEYLGDVDGIIHVAGGGYGFKEPLVEHEKFTKLINLNLLSNAELNRFIAQKMISQGYGNIVHIGSIASVEAVGSVAYNTAKAALNGYVRSLGNELAAYGVIVCGINPGGFHAPNNAMDRLQNNNSEAYENFVNTRLPKKKMAHAEELLPMIKLLSTKDASMMNGSMIIIDAGEGKSYERI